MKVEIKVPQAGESVTEAMISEWFVENGDQVEKDQAILELETDKANMELNAEEAGAIEISVEAGEVVKVGQVIGYIDTDAAGESASSGSDTKADEAEEETEEAPQADADKEEASAPKGDAPTSPAVRRIAEEKNLDLKDVKGSGKGGRVLKEDVQKAESKKKEEPKKEAPKQASKSAPAPAASSEGRVERVVPMSMMRRSIARRLVEAQHTAAILTTFNEIDMSAMMAMRNKYKDVFEKKHGVKLGFMSFFVKACIEALKHVPEINARIEDNNIVYSEFYDIGVAVGTPKGLVVPIVRDAETMTFAEIEQKIGDYALQARDGKIALDDLNGGTFTISNGGIYGSLMSTPIINPPQSGILGMHKIEKRAVVIDDQVVIRPMMYVALSYDHRIVDGKGAVTFLVKVKECIEDPSRIMLEI